MAVPDADVKGKKSQPDGVYDHHLSYCIRLYQVSEVCFSTVRNDNICKMFCIKFNFSYFAS